MAEVPEKSEKRSGKRSGESRSDQKRIKQETVRSIWAILSFFFTILLLSAAAHKAGVVGDWIFNALSITFGFGYYLLALLFVVLGFAFIRHRTLPWSWLNTAGYTLMFISALGLLHIIATPDRFGGIVGAYIAGPLYRSIDWFPTFVLLMALFAVGALIAFNAELRMDHFTTVREGFLAWWKERKGITDDAEPVRKITVTNEDTETTEDEEAEPSPIAAVAKTLIPKRVEAKVAAPRGHIPPPSWRAPFVPPPLELLEGDRGKSDTGDIKANANLIKRTMQNFGITVEMDEVSVGPSVTRFALKPAEGVKLSKIVALNDNLALALAAHPIRIEAPIPGKSLVGIEIPNTTKTTVGLGSMLSSEDFQGSDKPLLIGLGKGINGVAHFGNLAKAPHMLVAGATGSGKSVTIHAIINSLLYRNGPDTLRFIMIDPKRVELTLYNPIPHQLTPVITDAKKAILALKWAAKEMDRRYDILEKSSVRDIDSYHKNILGPAITAAKATNTDTELDPMPYIVIVIDEIADLMQAYPRELEAGIVRLAQMSRAVGIHLLLSTQRPSVNVITGLIKANVPTRIALQVSSQIDSRTILDAAGAEQLLGAGDMLYQSGDMAKPIRLQSAYVTEAETKKVVKYISDQYKDFVGQTVELSSNTQTQGDDNPIFSSSFDDEGEDDDELYEEARQIVIEAGKGSTSYIQRKLRVGYARAARLMDLLEDRGVIGPADGAKPREVIGLGLQNDEAVEAAATDPSPTAPENPEEKLTL